MYAPLHTNTLKNLKSLTHTRRIVGPCERYRQHLVCRVYN